jgi:hypothetical protein
MEQLINLAKKFILQPKVAWEIVKDDTTTAQQHLKNYLIPLTLIPVIATFIGHGFIGMGLIGPSLKWGLTEAVTIFIATIIGVYVSGFIIQKLGPTFEAQVSLDNAVKLVGFAYTPMLVAGILYIIPALGMLVGLAGLYSLYVLYTGFKPMTGVSEEKSTGYFIVSLITIIAVYIIIGIILGALFVTFGLGKAGLF